MAHIILSAARLLRFFCAISSLDVLERYATPFHGDWSSYCLQDGRRHGRCNRYGLVRVSDQEAVGGIEFERGL